MRRGTLAAREPSSTEKVIQNHMPKLPLKLVTAKAAGNYSTSVKPHDAVTGEPVPMGSLRLANNFTRNRVTKTSTKISRRNRPMQGRRGAISKKDPVLAAGTRVIIPTTGRFQLHR